MINGTDTDKVFNIVKESATAGSGSEGKSKEKKKYDFLLVSKLLGHTQSDGSVVCRVESSVLDPYFGVYTPVSVEIVLYCYVSSLMIVLKLSLQWYTNKLTGRNSKAKQRRQESSKPYSQQKLFQILS